MLANRLIIVQSRTVWKIEDSLCIICREDVISDQLPETACYLFSILFLLYGFNIFIYACDDFVFYGHSPFYNVGHRNSYMYIDSAYRHFLIWLVNVS